MGDPVTTTLIAGSQLLGGAMKAKGSRSAGRAAQQAAEFNADIIEQQGLQKEGLLRRRSRRQLGRMRTAIAKSGVQLEGSPLEALAASAAESEIDVLNARFDSQTAAKLERMGGASARKSANRAATAELLNTGLNLASSFGAFG